MSVKKLAYLSLLSAIITLPASTAPKKAIAANEASTKADHGSKNVVLWRDPVDISSRNLFYGPGGKAHQPQGTFTFVKEDLDGTNAKFVVRDSDDVKWKVKMGNETRPETAASRIVWAAGYYTNEDYFMPELRVQGMPAHLHRGQKMVSPDGVVHDVRMKREEAKKVGGWKWGRGPFAGTRELNGLRVVMALINNWDLKDENTAIYKEGTENVYAVSDLGASFGSASRTWPKEKSKGDLHSFERSKFLGTVTRSSVDFRVPARPSMIYIVNPKEYFQRIRMERIGRDIPREDVLWIARILSRLSQAQIRDAFRAAGYSPSEVEGFAAIVETRIRLLTDL